MKNKLYQLEQAFLNPSSQPNQDWLNRTIHDDFTEIGKSGKIYSKQEVISAFTAQKNGKITEILGFDCRQIDLQTWLVHYQTRHSGLLVYRTSIWLEKEARPQIYHHQATPLSASIFLPSSMPKKSEKISIRQNEMEMFIRDLQPSQFYLSEKKIGACREWMQSIDVEEQFSPLPIKQIGHRIFLTDGHTRAYLAYQAGWERVPVIWDEDELDWEAYLICVQTAEAKGIHSVADLATRILPEEEYQEKWLNWCQEIFHANQPSQKNP